MFVRVRRAPYGLHLLRSCAKEEGQEEGRIQTPGLNLTWTAKLQGQAIQLGLTGENDYALTQEDLSRPQSQTHDVSDVEAVPLEARTVERLEKGVVREDKLLAVTHCCHSRHAKRHLSMKVVQHRSVSVVCPPRMMEGFSLYSDVRETRLAWILRAMVVAPGHMRAVLSANPQHSDPLLSHAQGSRVERS